MGNGDDIARALVGLIGQRVTGYKLPQARYSLGSLTQVPQSPCAAHCAGVLSEDHRARRHPTICGEISRRQRVLDDSVW